MSYPDFDDSRAGGAVTVQTNPWAESGREVTPSDVMNALRDLKDRFDHMEREIVSHRDAFTVNDLGKPDFHGHRNDHKSLAESAKLMTNYKHDITKHILLISVAFILGLFATGIKDYIGNLPASNKTAAVSPAR